MSDDDLEQVSVRLGDLAINVSRSRRGGAPAGAASTSTSSASSSAAPSKAPPAAKAAPKRKASAAGSPRYYCVSRTAKGSEDLLGVHYVVWCDLQAKLLGGALFGSGCHAKGFDTLEAANAYWESEGWLPPAPLH